MHIDFYYQVLISLVAGNETTTSLQEKKKKTLLTAHRKTSLKSTAVEEYAHSVQKPANEMTEINTNKPLLN